MSARGAATPGGVPSECTSPQRPPVSARPATSLGHSVGGHNPFLADTMSKLQEDAKRLKSARGAVESSAATAERDLPVVKDRGRDWSVATDARAWATRDLEKHRVDIATQLRSAVHEVRAAVSDTLPDALLAAIAQTNRHAQDVYGACQNVIELNRQLRGRQDDVREVESVDRLRGALEETRAELKSLQSWPLVTQQMRRVMQEVMYEAGLEGLGNQVRDVLAGQDEMIREVREKVRNIEDQQAVAAAKSETDRVNAETLLRRVVDAQRVAVADAVRHAVVDEVRKSRAADAEDNQRAQGKMLAKTQELCDLLKAEQRGVQSRLDQVIPAVATVEGAVTRAQEAVLNEVGRVQRDQQAAEDLLSKQFERVLENQDMLQTVVTSDDFELIDGHRRKLVAMDKSQLTTLRDQLGGMVAELQDGQKGSQASVGSLLSQVGEQMTTMHNIVDEMKASRQSMMNLQEALSREMEIGREARRLGATGLVSRIKEIERRGNVAVDLRNGDVTLLKDIPFAARKPGESPPSAEFTDVEGTQMILADVAELQQLFAVKLTVEGHTHSAGKGNADYWQKLAQGRADEIKNFIARVFHIDDSFLDSVGLPGDLGLNQARSIIRLDIFPDDD
mmetsp:Transcript_54103/g.124013  ORF Transcript_54103/g.124013 Transcript_54103/m.124013 type:complete len:620 (+) Transcript_54103:20-1879(+)